MKYDKIVELLKGKNIVIPMYIYKIFPKLGIDFEDFFFLMYLTTNGDEFIFDAKHLAEEFNVDIKKVMEFISILQTKKLIELKIVTNENNIMEEYISLELFYDKVSMELVEALNKSKEVTPKNIFEILERELGKTLTPMEYEIVKAWKERNYSDEIIREAIKESVYSGVANLRYIDKILYEWSKKGIKNREDIEKSRKDFRKKDENNDTPKKLDLFDYDWMEDSND